VGFFVGFYKRIRQITGVFIAQSAIEFIVFVCKPFRATRSPASYHRVIASANFLKTHAMQITTIQPDPRAPSKKFLIQQPNGFRWGKC
jgi:hypothetical protein